MPTTTSRARVMQRVRIGLTGLACVFLLVLIGTASISNEAPAAKPDKPEETLAQLGIAPGSGEQSRSEEEQPAAEPAYQPIAITPPPDRKSVVQGRSVQERVDRGGGRRNK